MQYTAILALKVISKILNSVIKVISRFHHLFLVNKNE